jgi:DNA-binding transcriptional LysR family regulator
VSLDDATVLVRVVEQGSFAGAARLLGVPRSTVSRRISALEERLGVRLLQRTTRRLALTDAGAAYFERAGRAVQELADAEAAVSELGADPQGKLRVTAPIDFGTLYLPALVTEFCRRHPKVEFELDLGARPADLVREGFDLAFRGGTLPDSSLVARKLGEVRRVLFASPAYLAERGRPETPADLALHHCLRFTNDPSPARFRLQGPEGETSVATQGPLACNDFSFLRGAVIAGLGIALLPSFLCAEDVAAGRVEPVLPSYRGDSAKMHLLYPTGRHLPAKTRVFRDFILERLTPPPWERAG